MVSPAALVAATAGEVAPERFTAAPTGLPREEDPRLTDVLVSSLNSITLSLRLGVSNTKNGLEVLDD